MRQVAWVALGLFMCAISTAMAAGHGKASRSSLTAEQIVSRNVAARGGLKAWRAVKTLKISGTMEAGGKKNTELPFVLEMKRPHRSRLEIRFRGQTAVQVYDGKQGWKVRPFLGRNDAEPFSPAEAKAASGWAELDGPLVDYVRKGTKITLDGQGAVSGHKAYKLVVTMNNGTQRRIWVDASSFLELKIDGDPKRLDGTMHHVSVYYRDYKTEGGLTTPRLFETVVDGARGSHKMHIEQVVVNPPMADGIFGKPTMAIARAPTPPVAR